MSQGHRYSVLYICAAAVLIVGAFWSDSGYAAIERLSAPLNKKNVYIEEGAFTGGEAGVSFTLRDVRVISSPKTKTERILIDIGDEHGQPLLNKVSYFQVSIEKDKPRVVIDLSQMAASGVDAKKIQELFKKSPMVREAKINFDPVNVNISIQLFLKKNVQLEVFQLQAKGQPGRIAVDLKSKG